MPDQNLLEERFEALRDAPGAFAPPVDAATLRRRGHTRTVRRRAAAAVAGGTLLVGAVLGAGGLLEGSAVDRTFVPPASPAPPVQETAAPSPSVVAEPEPDTSDPQPDPEAPATDAPVDDGTAAPEPVTGQGLLPHEVPADGTDFGYVTGYFAKGGTIYLVFDRATLLTGEEARAAMDEDGVFYDPELDSLYIRNQNPALREVAVDDFATVMGSQMLLGDAAQGPAQLELADLMLYLDGGGRPLPVELTFDGVRVGTVTEFYTP